jgi:hypothetical protein
MKKTITKHQDLSQPQAKPEKENLRQGDLSQVFQVLAPVEYPSAQEIQVERNKFIRLIAKNEPIPVSLPLFTRIKKMTRQIMPHNSDGYKTPRKERYVMSTALIRIMVITSIIFTMATGTFASALTSLPDSPLYDAKMTMEQVGLNLLHDPAKIAQKHLALAQNRVKEMVKQSQQGDVPEQGTLERLQQHLAYALHYAAQVQGDGMQSILAQAQTMAQNQIQTLAQVQTQLGENPADPIGIALQLMNQFMFQLQFGLADSAGFRYQHQNAPDMASLDVVEADCTPIGDEHKYSQTSSDGSAGPGPQFRNPDCDNCEPLGDEHKYGQDTQSSISSDADCQDCVPLGDENKYGPQPSQPGPGEPGGNPDCPDCDPDGDKNQYGPQPTEPPGSGGQGGNPDCPNCDCPDCPDCPNCDCSDCPICNPDGDQNQNGKN